MVVHPRGTESAVSWPDARARALAAGAPTAPRELPLDACAGAVLAAPLRALAPLPPFDTCAMDGWAVAGAGPWRVVGELLAGRAWPEPLAEGTALGIATGAPVPAGATAVLPVENAFFAGDLVNGPVEPGRHVRRAGEECATGDALLPEGWVITAAVLGLAAAAGHDRLAVHPRPSVVALVTGDELLDHGLPRDGLVRDALGPQLARLVSAAGGELLGRQHVADDADLLAKALAGAAADLVVTTGASSAGPADHLRGVLADLGAQVLVDGVACRPGHPQLLALLPDGRLVVGLPGNPLAALVAAVTVLAPALAGLGGRELPPPRAALLTTAIRAAEHDTRLVPVRLRGLTAEPTRHAGSGMLRGAALADALAVVPPGPSLEADAEVEVLPLP